MLTLICDQGNANSNYDDINEKIHGSKNWQEPESMRTVSPQWMGVPSDTAIWKQLGSYLFKNVKLMYSLIQQLNFWESGLSRVHKETHKRMSPSVF